MVHRESLKTAKPLLSELVWTGCQSAMDKFVQASTTTKSFVVQSRLKLNPLVMLELMVRIAGIGDHKTVGRSPNVVSQPVVLGRKKTIAFVSEEKTLIPRLGAFPLK